MKQILRKTCLDVLRESAIQRIVKNAEEKCGKDDFIKILNHCQKQLQEKLHQTPYEIELRLLGLK